MVELDYDNLDSLGVPGKKLGMNCRGIRKDGHTV